MATWNWRRILGIAALTNVVLLLVGSCTTIVWQNVFGSSEPNSADSPDDQSEETGEILVAETTNVVVETFQVLPSGQLDLLPGVVVLVSNNGGEFLPVGETVVEIIAGIPAPIWKGDVNVGSWITVDPPDNCIIWKVGTEWGGSYLVSAEYADKDLVLKFQLICGENIVPSPTSTQPPSGPEVTPTNPPENPTETPPPPPTRTPPPNTPEPTEVDCNCETPETAVPTPEPPNEPTATPIW